MTIQRTYLSTQYCNPSMPKEIEEGKRFSHSRSVLAKPTKSILKELYEKAESLGTKKTLTFSQNVDRINFDLHKGIQNTFTGKSESRPMNPDMSHIPGVLSKRKIYFNDRQIAARDYQIKEHDANFQRLENRAHKIIKDYSYLFDKATNLFFLRKFLEHHKTTLEVLQRNSLDKKALKMLKLRLQIQIGLRHFLKQSKKFLGELELYEINANIQREKYKKDYRIAIVQANLTPSFQKLTHQSNTIRKLKENIEQELGLISLFGQGNLLAYLKRKKQQCWNSRDMSCAIYFSNGITELNEKFASKVTSLQNLESLLLNLSRKRWFPGKAPLEANVLNPFERHPHFCKKVLKNAFKNYQSNPIEPILSKTKDDSRPRTSSITPDKTNSRRPSDCDYKTSENQTKSIEASSRISESLCSSSSKDSRITISFVQEAETSKYADVLISTEDEKKSNQF